MSRIFIVDLEPLESRYTKDWKTHIPKILREKGHDVTVISGPEDMPKNTTPGAFLDFYATNAYKARQVENMARLFCAGEIKDGDHFLFTDAWHPGIINLRYMADLGGVKIITSGLWHAGGYDEKDILGQKLGNTKWREYAEKSFFEAFDHNYFASKFHIDLFCKELLGMNYSEACGPSAKIIRTGWPMEYEEETLKPYKDIPKENIVLFPHRISPEKQVEIFRDLANYIPEAQFIVGQDIPRNKHEYYQLLGRTKIIFSASLHENLGISTCAEGPLLGCIPLAPNRLSYKEIFNTFPEFIYPSEWTLDWNNYLIHRDHLVNRIKFILHNYEKYQR